jgi:hypothetical protein
MTTDDDADRELAGAFRAVRERFDGTHAESDLTLKRALLATRKQKRARRLVR